MVNRIVKLILSWAIAKKLSVITRDFSQVTTDSFLIFSSPRDSELTILVCIIN